MAIQKWAIGIWMHKQNLKYKKNPLLIKCVVPNEVRNLKILRCVQDDTRKNLLGYTLIEVLVVLLIISIVSSIVLLRISFNEDKEILNFANEIQETLFLAEEKALLQPMVLGLSLNEHSLQFMHYQGIETKKKWISLQDHMLGQHAIPAGLELVLVENGKSVDSSQKKHPLQPQIIFSMNGDVSPFQLYVGKKGKKPRYLIQGDVNGTITKQLLS